MAASADDEGQRARSARLRVGPLLGFACILLIAGYAALLAWAALKGTWLVGPHGEPAPADFNGLWAAARLSAEGRAEEAYGWPALEQVLAAAGRPARTDQVFPFFYPPVFLFWLKPLGTLLYAGSAAIWLSLTGTAYLAAVRLASGRALAFLSALAAPAAFACVYVGQNGLLTAALAGAAFAVLPSRPALAGMLIGLMAYKPQFGIALPILLLAGRRWRVAGVAALTVIATYALAGAVLGWDAYARCLDQLLPRGGALPAIGTLPPAKLQSLYGLARTVGVASPLAWLLQVAAALIATVLSAQLWRRGAPRSLQAAAAVATMLIVSPYSVLYDYPLLSIALVFILKDEERASIGVGQGAILVLAFCAPFASAAFALPLCPLGAALALGVTLVRASAAITKVSSSPRHPNAAVLAS